MFNAYIHHHPWLCASVVRQNLCSMQLAGQRRGLLPNLQMVNRSSVYLHVYNYDIYNRMQIIHVYMHVLLTLFTAYPLEYNYKLYSYSHPKMLLNFMEK